MIKGIFVVVALTSSLAAVSTLTSSNSIDTLSAVPNVRFKLLDIAAVPNVRFKSLDVAAVPNVRFTENAFA